MPGIIDVSLAVIAAASVVAVLVAIPVLLQIRRTAARAESLLAQVEGTLPALLAELREATAKAERTMDAMDGLAESMERMDRLTAAAARSLELAGAVLRHMAADVVAPSVANAAGLLAVLREGIQWVWPRGERRRIHDRTP
ncbi:MAG TPA: DUF948 domain-containing protein [bacterium]|nr:DUF948 domain-containing protein [bacterium]